MISCCPPPTLKAIQETGSTQPEGPGLPGSKYTGIHLKIKKKKMSG